MTSIRLAPLAGVTDWPFRLLCFEQGCDCAYTEMVSAMGYSFMPKDHPGTVSLLTRAPGEKKLILQIFGKEPEVMARAAAELGATGTYDGIDTDTETVAVSAVILARDDVSEDAIYTLTADIFDNAPDLVNTHAKYAELSVDKGASITSVPYHPGAAKYFEEQGITVPTK